MRFPKLIHVTIEEPANDEPYLAVTLDGPLGADRSQRMALYKLVMVGDVVITKRFVTRGSRKRD